MASRTKNSEFQASDSNPKKNMFSVPTDSLLGMALYDFDAKSIPSINSASIQRHIGFVAPAFHPVDEYKDLSLKEILDLTDDFLMPDQAFGQFSQPKLFEPLPAQSFFPDVMRIGQHHLPNFDQHDIFAPSQPKLQLPAANFMNVGKERIPLNASPPLPVEADVVKSCVVTSEAELPPDDLEEMAKRSYGSNQENVDNFAASDELFDDEVVVTGRSEAVVPLDIFSSTVNDTRNCASNKRSHVSLDDSANESDCDESDDNECCDPSDRRFRPYQAGQWSEKFAELCEYNDKMGHCLVPHTYTENLALARWVKRQRYQYKLMVEGKSSTMTEDRVKALEDIGFVWDSQGAAWGDRLHELQMFKREFQHCNVPSNYSENPRLATWIKCQRRQYKLYCENKSSNMTPQRIHELEKLGFEWELRCYKKVRTA